MTFKALGNRMKFRLEEKILNEDTYPVYREMLFNLIEYLAKNSPLGKFLDTVDRQTLEFHHIDSDYANIGTTNRKRYKARNNHPSNIAIVTKSLHNEITKINKTCKSAEERLERFYEIMKQHPNEIYYLVDYLPNGAITAIATEVNDSTDELVTV